MKLAHAVFALLLAAGAAAAVELEGPAYLVGTWTTDGDCRDGDVIARDGDAYKSKFRGRMYKGNIIREGSTIKTDFVNEDGYAKRVEYEISNDNRVRLVSFTMCDAVHCEFVTPPRAVYFLRCSE